MNNHPYYHDPSYPYTAPVPPQYSGPPTTYSTQISSRPNGYPYFHFHPHPGPMLHYSPVNYHHSHQNGWYNVTTAPPNERSPGHSPQYPPGLAVPPHLMPTTHEPTTHEPTSSPSPDIPHPPQFHDFWVGRLAPLPGYCSRPILFPRRESELPEKTQVIQKKEEKIQKIKKDFQFDAYAEAYIPKYLANIQKQLHPLKPLPAVPPFPSIKYLQSFLIPRIIEESLKSDDLALLHDPPISKDSKISALEIETYHDHWGEILRWELDAIAHEKEQIAIWRISFKVVSWEDSEFVFSVPGIRENHPYLEIGDLVHLREILQNEKRGSNRAFEGRVSALVKREGLVHIISPPLREHVQTFVPLTLQTTTTKDGYVVFDAGEMIPFTFNVSFMTSSRPICAMERAVACVADIMNDSTPGINLARQWLFPNINDFVNAPAAMLRAEIDEAQWVDKGLNPEQRLAVSAVSLFQAPIPHLISGPPGTGKTRTVVEAVLQIFKIQPEACILVCAPSNPATDTLALRLLEHLQQHEMFRLNDPNRTFAEVPDKLKHYCYIENDRFGLPPFKKLMQYRVVICSCLDANILVKAQCTNAKLMSMEEEVTRSLHPNRKHKLAVQPHWTHLLIDEAAQGSEPELVIPISVVVPAVYDSEAAGKTFMPQLALCGDINQLGPRVVSEEARTAEFEVSLLERLFERPLYSSSNKEETQIRVSQQAKRLLPYTSLVKNYRSHPVILMPPSAIFYNDSLQPCAKNGIVAYPGLKHSHLPLKFIGTESSEKSTDEKASWFNPGQINTVIEVIKSLLDNSSTSVPPLKEDQIGVMAPWRKQVWTLRKRLRNEGLHTVDVGTVEDYQGRENRVIILSCVRSNERFLEEDHKKGLGLIFERKRMNVAITRAKELLIVIGNAALLKRDPYWKSFLQFSIRNNLYEGPKLSLEMDGSYISRMESELTQDQDNIAELDPERRGILLAGGVAREVLRE